MNPDYNGDNSDYAKEGRRNEEIKHKKVICFDFDGVIASYDGWKGFDVLGEPNLDVIGTMNDLHSQGLYITILTTRMATPVLVKWLKDNKVTYDSINSNSHNPVSTSQKPIYDVIVDDRAVRYRGQVKNELTSEIKECVKHKE